MLDLYERHWVYGTTGETIATEDSPLRPPSIVVRRPELERIVLDAAESGVHGIVIRLGIVYGNGGGIPSMFVTSARDRGAATILGEGTNHWACVHVDDLGALFALAVESAPSGVIFNATDGSTFTMREIAQAASRGALKDGATSNVPAGAMGQFGEALALDQRVSSERARRDLHWAPSAPSIVEDLERGSYALVTGPS